MKLIYTFIAFFPLTLLANPKENLNQLLTKNSLHPQKMADNFSVFKTPEGKFTLYEKNGSFTAYHNGAEVTEASLEEIIEFLKFCEEKRQEREAQEKKLAAIELNA